VNRLLQNLQSISGTNHSLELKLLLYVVTSLMIWSLKIVIRVKLIIVRYD